MKIDLPTSIINQLLIESETFRRHIIDNHVNAAPTDCIDYYRHLVRTEFPNWSQNKIPPIKWIREITRNKMAVLDLFAKHGYDSYAPAIGCDNLLTLSGAKRFIESIK